MVGWRGTAARAAVVLILLCQSACTFGVGAFFVRESGSAKVYMPGARAFVHRSGSREDLILQVGFAGSAEDFGWVVPVPTRPGVEIADPAIFDELRRIFNPLIIPGKRAATPAERKPAAEQPKPVPIQEITVLSPDQPGAFARWLETNHFEAPPEAHELIRGYVKRRWYLVAVHIRTSPAPEARWIRPLWIAFQSPRAAFPLLLTSLSTKPILTQLYVAADVIVKAPGFLEIETTGSPLRTKYRLGEFPLFFHIVTRDRKLTELRATLDPKKIDSDIVISPK
jgi:hypothetical protein